jgi:hypothetical protein
MKKIKVENHSFTGFSWFAFWLFTTGILHLDCCALRKSEDLIKKKVYGLFTPHPKLVERVGDYVLIMKENYIIKDTVLGEEKKFNIGNHGGLNEEEMQIPLSVVRL